MSEFTISALLLVIAIVCFAIGAVQSYLGPDISRVSWTNAGLAFAAASLLPWTT